MKRIALTVVVLVALALGVGWAMRRGGAAEGTVEVRREPMQVWAAYDGYIESRTVRNIMPKMGGSATVIELAPEGATVQEGDVLVRFDSSQFDREALRLERDYRTALSDLDSLTNAKLPLEARDLEMRVLKAEADYAAEEKFLKDSRELLAEKLVAEAEVEQQKQKVDSMKAQAENLQEQLKLTREFLHPAAIERAQTALRSAEQELAAAQRQISNCTIYAPAGGVVVYKPVAVGGEYRTARVGDTLFKNQPFMALPDMSNLVVHLEVPESELSRVQLGQAVTVYPRAFPDRRFEGTVENIASMAQSRADRPSWQRYFHVIVALRNPGEALRSGMSVLCKILVLDESDALVVPRAAVRWEGGDPYVMLARHGKRSKTPVKLGIGNEQRFLVLDGLRAGDRVEEE